MGVVPVVWQILLLVKIPNGQLRVPCSRGAHPLLLTCQVRKARTQVASTVPPSWGVACRVGCTADLPGGGTARSSNKPVWFRPLFKCSPKWHSHSQVTGSVTCDILWEVSCHCVSFFFEGRLSGPVRSFRPERMVTLALACHCWWPAV